MPIETLPLQKSTSTGRPEGAVSFRAVNGWRGPGALAIAIAHFSAASGFIAYRRVEPMALLVDLFFVLSGLIIAQVYSQKLTRPAAIPEYIVRRFGRIWPLQAATLALLVAYELVKLVLQTVFGHHFSSPAFAADGYNLLRAIPTNLLLVHSIGMHDRETWNFPSWSLSVEFVTYISFAAFCLVQPVLRRVLAILTIAGSLAVLVFVAPYHMRSTFDYGIFRCFAGFFAGTLCYDVARKWRAPEWRRPTLIEAGGLALTIGWMAVSKATILVFAAPFVFCAFILAFASERGAISRVLLTKPMQFFAELSFAIYMVHAVVLIFLLAALHALERHLGVPLFTKIPNPLAGHPGAPDMVEVMRIASPVALWACAVFYVTTVLACAYGAYRLIEVPGRAWFGRLAKRVDLRRAPTILARPAEPAP